MLRDYGISLGKADYVTNLFV
ncbi:MULTISPECIES: hypothetical protein [Stenotrophomonas]|nr:MULTISPECIES: hypothetical protein [Stenotrophomonas]